ncbi:uncharacterized protein LOC110708958 [Chenopodium quinoa]|uniref:uncharacterized protein LOC110708958 n=1 Tax=Chenopodium quinoa TaxID=63459 RepID=UPI000B792E39|nr:uncharacterized protein LOC110708958 [Chenopodium quinoa]
MKVDEVVWTPFDRNPHQTFPIALYSGVIHYRDITEPYMSDRVLRQFGYVQIIPLRLLHPKTSYRGPENNKYKCKHDENLRAWDSWMNHCFRVGEAGSYRANFSTEMVEGYLDYYQARTHIRIHRDVALTSMPIESCDMSEVARLQYLGARAYPLHPDIRHRTDDVTFWQCLDDLTRHLEDWMSRLQDDRRRRGGGGNSRRGSRRG